MGITDLFNHNTLDKDFLPEGSQATLANVVINQSPGLRDDSEELSICTDGIEDLLLKVGWKPHEAFNEYADAIIKGDLVKAADLISGNGCKYFPNREENTALACGIIHYVMDSPHILFGLKKGNRPNDIIRDTMLMRQYFDALVNRDVRALLEIPPSTIHKIKNRTFASVDRYYREFDRLKCVLIREGQRIMRQKEQSELFQANFLARQKGVAHLVPKIPAKVFYRQYLATREGEPSVSRVSVLYCIQPLSAETNLGMVITPYIPDFDHVPCITKPRYQDSKTPSLISYGPFQTNVFTNAGIETGFDHEPSVAELVWYLNCWGIYGCYIDWCADYGGDIRTRTGTESVDKLDDAIKNRLIDLGDSLNWKSLKGRLNSLPEGKRLPIAETLYSLGRIPLV